MKNKEKEFLTKIDKFKKFFIGKSFTLVMAILAAILLSITFFTFKNNKSISTSISSEENYSSKGDKETMVITQNLIDTRLDLLSEINDITSRRDLNKSEKVKFIKDIRNIMQDNSKAFNEQIKNIDSISRKPKDDITRMNKINTESLSYADDAIDYVENKNTQSADKLLKDSSRIQKDLSKMYFNDFKNREEFTPLDELKKK